MLNKVKSFITACFIFVSLKVMGLLYRKEMNLIKENLKKSQDYLTETKKKLLDEQQKYHDSLSTEEQRRLEVYTELQNDVFSAFARFCKHMQDVPGTEMDETAQIWVQTVNSLNKTLERSFASGDELRIKQNLYQVEQELQIVLESNQEIIPGGPVGNA